MQPNIVLQEQNKDLKSQIDLRDFAKDYLNLRTHKDTCISSDCVCGAKQQINKKDTHCQVNKENIHCFVCDKTFDVFDLIQAKENCNFATAKQKVASILNVELEKPKSKSEQLFFDKEFNDTCINNQNNNFSIFCKEKLGISETHLKSWGVGTFGKGLTIFLQKDLQGKVWNYQAIAYNELGKKSGALFSAIQPESIKNEKPNFYSSLLYGFHLLREEKNIPIIVVESPKSAVIASHFYPQYDFVACMSANGLTEYFCELLKNTHKPIYWLCDADGNEYNELDKILYGGRLNSSITNLSKTVINSSVVDLFPNYKYANNHIEGKYHYDIADFIVDNILDLHKKIVQLPNLLNPINIYSSVYYVENIYLTANTNKQDIKFWEIGFKGKENIVNIDVQKFIDFLTSKGFCHINISEKDSTMKQFVKIQNNIIDYADKKTVQDFLNYYVLQKLPEIIWESDKEEKKGTKYQYVYKQSLLNELYSKSSFLYSENMLNNIHTIEPNFLKDTENICYKPFLNGVLKVEKGSNVFTMVKFENLKGLIWKNQIIKRKFEQLSYDVFSEFNFFKYLELTQNCESNKPLFDNRFKNLIKTLGYLLHSYKDQTEPKLIIAIDEGSDDSEKGGSGKSIVFHKALKNFADVAYQDAKTWDFSKNTRFDFIKYGEKIAVVNDLVQNFPIDALYNATTDDMNIKFLYKDSVLVDFKDSPKFVCTTNFTIGGSKNADIRRLHIVEFSSYFKKNNTSIIKHFGETFFQKWTSEQWNKFDNIMIYCIQKWLNDFTLESIDINYNEKKLRESIDENNLLLLDNIFRPEQIIDDELLRVFIKGKDNAKTKQYLIDTLYPPHERKKSIIHYYTLLKKDLEIYFNYHSKEVKLRYTKNMYPYYSNGAEHLIFIEE